MITMSVHAGTRAHVRGGGFTLIEVLIGIIVLGLGLLGLAAIFPAVVVQQRSAGDAVLGESVAESAKNILQGLERLNAPGNGWDSARLDAADPTLPSTFGSVQVAGRDVPAWEQPFVTANVIGSFSSDPATGDITIGDEGAASEVVHLPVQARLFPLPRRGATTTSDEPKYVWDFAVRRQIRRVSGGDFVVTVNDPLQVAVFVRRIDSAIRRAPLGEQGATMHDRFLPVGASPLEYLPVVVDNNGVPTFDGRVRAGTSYSGILLVEFDDLGGDFDAGFDRMRPRQLIERNTTNPISAGLRPLLAQVGQRVLLNSGKILTVVSVEGDDVILDKKIDRTDLTPRQVGSGTGIYGLMTPQIPVAIQSFTVEKPSSLQ